MHGLGNDFMIIDAREDEILLTEHIVRILSNRNFGVGFDQLAVIQKPISLNADCYLKFWNRDGSVSSTCGNASRCIADLIMKEKDISSVTLETDNGLLSCKKIEDNLISVNMGEPKFDWTEIPLAIKCDTLHLPLEGDPVGTNIGNPHCTFFVADIDSIDLASIGKTFETHQLFPDNTNVQVAQLTDVDTIRVKVWERGVGKTSASGSSSCAVAVAAFRRGLTTKRTKIILDGGVLNIFWSDNGVWMSGKTKKVFVGELTSEFLSDLGRQ